MVETDANRTIAVLEPPAPVNRRFQFGRYVDVVRILAARTLKGRYRGSILGVYWSLSHPLIMTFIYTAIFGTAFASYYNNSILDYVLACFVGLSVMNFFSQATAQALGSIVGNGALLNKIRLPLSVFPISAIASNTFQFAIGILPLLAIITGWTSHSPINIVALLIPTVALLLVSIGFGLITCSLYVFFRDLSYLYEMFVFLIWITSPIFYPAQLVPAAIRPFIALNPIATIVENFRQIALSGQPPALHLMFPALGGGLLFLALGIMVFAYLKDDFMDLI
jgi:ABC-type polysaccharide/polyol phosphate export permease